jgi:hypothetical protein
MKEEKVITFTTVGRWIAILVFIVVPVSFVITVLRGDATMLEVFKENWVSMAGGLVPAAMLLQLTSKKKDIKEDDTKK